MLDLTNYLPYCCAALFDPKITLLLLRTNELT